MTRQQLFVSRLQISIPTGSIKILHEHSEQKVEFTFQFQLVRLKFR